MHRVRASAHNAAWYNDDDTPNWNPFGKIRSRESQPSNISDPEKGDVPRGPLSRGKTYRSTNSIEPTDDLDRKARDGPGPDQISPVHGVTMPASPNKVSFTDFSSHDPTERARNDASEDSNAATSDTLQGDENQPEETLPSGVTTHGPTDKAGPRNRSWGIFKRKEEKNPAEGVDEQDDVPKKKRFTFKSQIQNTLLNSWINVLLVMAPIGIALNYTKVPPVAVFIINFIAIIPLAAMLSYATEEIALRTGETIGGLLNATFGNAVELIVSIIALIQGQVLIVQTSLIGSILSNLLLVMGMCFFFGGIPRERQYFNQTVAQTAASLLALAVASLIIPAAFSAWANGAKGPGTQNANDVTALSRGTSILLLLVYGSYLFFQLKTHAAMYNAPSKKVAKRRHKKGDASKSMAHVVGMTAGTMGGGGGEVHENLVEGNKQEEPNLHIWVAVATLAISTAIVAVCAEYMVSSISALTETYHISPTFVGLILLPIVGNAAEHATAVTVACKDKMDLAIGVAVGSSMQIALFVLPLVVTIGWIMGQSLMNLNFDGFQIAILFVAVLLVNYLISDGESHWLEGVLLMVLYLIIAVAAWFYPPPQGANIVGRSLP